MVSSTPSKALASLEHDATELILNGMVTLSSKLKNIDDERIVSRVVDLWTFFWGQVLPYVEGVSPPLLLILWMFIAFLGSSTASDRTTLIFTLSDSKEPQTDFSGGRNTDRKECLTTNRHPYDSSAVLPRPYHLPSASRIA